MALFAGQFLGNFCLFVENCQFLPLLARFDGEICRPFVDRQHHRQVCHQSEDRSSGAQQFGDGPPARLQGNRSQSVRHFDSGGATTHGRRIRPVVHHREEGNRRREPKQRASRHPLFVSHTIVRGMLGFLHFYVFGTLFLFLECFQEFFNRLELCIFPIC